MRRKCDFCGQTYTAKTKRSRYCSDKCRVYAHQGKSAWVKVAPGEIVDAAPLVPSTVTGDEITQAIVQLKGAAATLDAAATIGPERSRDLCRRLSSAVIAAVREVGL